MNRLSHWLDHAAAYLIVGILSVLLGLYASSQLAQRALSQEPSDIELPQEFLEGLDQLEPIQKLEQVPPEAGLVPIDGGAAQAPLPLEENLQTIDPLPAGGMGLPLLAPGMSGADSYVYDPGGKRDPFKNPTIEQKVTLSESGIKELAPEAKPIELEPLQKFRLNELKILAIMWDIKDPRARVMDPSGQMHTIKKNTKIGVNNGYVAEIREGEIVVIESFVENEKIIKEAIVLEVR